MIEPSAHLARVRGEPLGYAQDEEVAKMFSFKRDSTDAERTKPPIDLEVPPQLETATFAVG